MGRLGVDPFYLFILVFIFQIVLVILLVIVYMKYCHLKKNYDIFMRGRKAKNLEKIILSRFKELEKVSDLSKKNEREIKKINRQIKKCYQKTAIVKYDAFQEMGGDLSFVLTMLDENDNGWLFNAMHSKEGCYTYSKEIINGECDLELAEEEMKCLEKAMYQKN